MGIPFRVGTTTSGPPRCIYAFFVCCVPCPRCRGSTFFVLFALLSCKSLQSLFISRIKLALPLVQDFPVLDLVALHSCLLSGMLDRIVLDLQPFFMTDHC